VLSIVVALLAAVILCVVCCAGARVLMWRSESGARRGARATTREQHGNGYMSFVLFSVAGLHVLICPFHVRFTFCSDNADGSHTVLWVDCVYDYSLFAENSFAN